MKLFFPDFYYYNQHSCSRHCPACYLPKQAIEVPHQHPPARRPRGEEKVESRVPGCVGAKEKESVPSSRDSSSQSTLSLTVQATRPLCFSLSFVPVLFITAIFSLMATAAFAQPRPGGAGGPQGGPQGGGPRPRERPRVQL